jgi:hypothetical protein
MTEDSRTEPVPSRGDAAGAYPRSVERTDVDALLTILERIMAAGRPGVRPAASGEILRRWEDEHYIYFGARLPDNGRNVDINIHDGTLMIRLEKAPEEAGFEQAAGDGQTEPAPPGNLGRAEPIQPAPVGSAGSSSRPNSSERTRSRSRSI